MTNTNPALPLKLLQGYGTPTIITTANRVLVARIESQPRSEPDDTSLTQAQAVALARLMVHAANNYETMLRALLLAFTCLQPGETYHQQTTQGETCEKLANAIIAAGQEEP